MTSIDVSAHPRTENAAEFAWQRDDVFGRIATAGWHSMRHFAFFVPAAG